MQYMSEQTTNLYRGLSLHADTRAVSSGQTIDGSVLSKLRPYKQGTRYNYHCTHAPFSPVHMALNHDHWV